MQSMPALSTGANAPSAAFDVSPFSSAAWMASAANSPVFNASMTPDE